MTTGHWMTKVLLFKMSLNQMSVVQWFYKKTLCQIIFSTCLDCAKVISRFTKSSVWWKYWQRMIKHLPVLRTKAVVVAQLVERSPPTPEVCRSKPAICKLLYRIFVFCQLCWKRQNKEIGAWNGPFKKQHYVHSM